MADVIVRGMEMPVNCYGCRFVVDGWCCVNPASKTRLISSNDTRRLDWCPLEPAPEWLKFATREPDADEREAHPDWEFVLDCRLPDDGERILVNVVHRGSEAVQMDEFYADAEGCYLDSGYEIGTEVTHWMPLPAPPKGDDDDA